MTDLSGWLGNAGEVTAKRKIRSVSPYRFLFPAAKGERVTVKRNAKVNHTVKFIPAVVFATQYQSEKFARYILEPTLKETCRRLWQWVYDHIRYEKDTTGSEEVRSPVRLVSDQTGDCDCFTTFLDSVLVNVRKITGWKFSIVNRITKYGGSDNFQHIYPYVKTPDGERIILDCVTEYFNYEVPFTGKEDFLLMDLVYLNGIDSYDLQKHDFNLQQSVEDDSDETAAAELGRLALFKRKEKNKDSGEKEKGSGIKKAVHSVNKVNPAVALLRTGILASMKLNVMNVAGRLKWSYLSSEKAQAKGFDMNRFAKLLAVREKLEKIFYAAGGSPEKLREAILTGKGNKGKEVSGIGVIPIYAMNESGLGEPVTAASLAAASAAIVTLSEMLKKIGAMKPGGENSDDPDHSGDEVAPNELLDSKDNKSSDRKGGSDEPAKFMDNPLQWAKENPGTATVAVLAVVAAAYGGYKWYQASKTEVEDLPLKYNSSSFQTEPVSYVEMSD